MISDFMDFHISVVELGEMNISVVELGEMILVAMGWRPLGSSSRILTERSPKMVSWRERGMGVAVMERRWGMVGDLAYCFRIIAFFLLGEDEMLETFEEKLQEFKEGDEFKFVLTKDEAYGDEDEDAVVEFPKNTFGEDDKMPEVGDYVPMEDEDGTVFDGTVYEITDDSIFIDFNHPLAGEDLYFTGKIIKVEDAPSE